MVIRGVNMMPCGDSNVLCEGLVRRTGQPLALVAQTRWTSSTPGSQMPRRRAMSIRFRVHLFQLIILLFLPTTGAIVLLTISSR